MGADVVVGVVIVAKKQVTNYLGKHKPGLDQRTKNDLLKKTHTHTQPALEEPTTQYLGRKQAEVNNKEQRRPFECRKHERKHRHKHKAFVLRITISVYSRRSSCSAGPGRHKLKAGEGNDGRRRERLRNGD